jgi:ribosome-binding ATPase YchF (GTP1/OBG family)
MKIGLVGYQGSGKSTLFEWLTGTPADPSLAHSSQSAMAMVPEARVAKLCEIYKPKKVTMAGLEIVDTPGLSRKHEGNAARLAVIREAGCMVLVLSAFDRSDPLADLRSLEEDLLLADMEIVTGRIKRIEETLRKPIPKAEKDQLAHEEATLKLVLAAMEDGRPLRETDLTDEQAKVTRAFRLFGEKRRLVIVNTADDEADPQRFVKAAPEGVGCWAVPVGLELELSRMTPTDREEFEKEMNLVGADKDHLVRTIMEASGQTLFLTAGEKEVRTWMIPQGATAVEAAGSIHTDLARGFIRAEIMTCDDLFRLGSEREVKAHHLMRQEPKDYVIRDGDILYIRFSV